MKEPLDIDWNRPDERDAILAFIAAMGFTPRDAKTWDGLAMRAIVARRGEAIVGVLPVERRDVCIGAGQVARGVHQTCVAVAPAERGTGIGSAMQARLAALVVGDADLISVYREDPASAAYAWYELNGFARAMGVVSWTKPVDLSRQQKPHAALCVPTDLAELWREAKAESGFFVDQRARPLDGWLPIHPYRSRYTFETLAVSARAYAVVGIGQLHSSLPRLDVLDLVATTPDDAIALLDQCVNHASARGAASIRIALAATDPLGERLATLGFVPGWPFDLLVKSPVGERLGERPDWRYASIDFI